MTVLIATLHSSESDRCAIALLDREHGMRYLQIETLPPVTRLSQLRAITCHEERLFVGTPANILVYSVQLDNSTPIFKQEDIIQLPEWLLGPGIQADLLGMLISSRRRRILVANNLFNAIDELSLEGVFLHRHFLFNIAPACFPPPERIRNQPFRYGHIRNIAENSNGEIWLTIFRPDDPDSGCVLDFDSGSIILDRLSTPHGGLFYNNHFFLQEVQNGRLLCYSLATDGRPGNAPLWDVVVKAGEDPDTCLNLRGMTTINNTIYCGACLFDAGQKNEFQPRILAFDADKGRQQKNAILLPDLEEFRNSRVFFLASLPDLPSDALPEKMIVFRGGVKVEGRLHSVQNQPQARQPEISDPMKRVIGALNDEAKGDPGQPAAQKASGSGNPEVSPPLPDKLKKERDREKIPNPSGEVIGPVSVALENVSLYYRRNAMSLFSFNRQKRRRRDFQALADISFTLHEGETLGIIGRNGSGKSTISMVISGALAPDEGKVTTRGRVQLLSIGLGFRNELTGRENVYINGALLGLSKQVIMDRFHEIEEFAELGQFIDEPVRTYSAGMRSRLGFAVATAVSPDILILDEVMSTGDAAFRKKANKRMEEMRERTKTIIIISHSTNQVKKMCSRVIWLYQGRLLMDGQPEIVISEYDNFCRSPQAWIKANQDKLALIL